MFSTLGKNIFDGFVFCGELCVFVLTFWKILFLRRPRFSLWLQQAEFVGVGSLFIVLLTGLFTGGVFALQLYDISAKVRMESLVGSSVMLTVTKELGPVLTALMVTGRVGSSFATELGTMRVTEQIDALEVMAVDPMHYLIVPRVVAAVLMVPMLTILFDAVAFVGAYGVAIGFLHIDEGAFLARIQRLVDPQDFIEGIIKGIFFGFLLAQVSCFKGFHAKGGSRGVGLATTEAVVLSFIAVFVVDYVLTSLMLA